MGEPPFSGKIGIPSATKVFSLGSKSWKETVDKSDLVRVSTYSITCMSYYPEVQYITLDLTSVYSDTNVKRCTEAAVRVVEVPHKVKQLILYGQKAGLSALLYYIYYIYAEAVHVHQG